MGSRARCVTSLCAGPFLSGMAGLLRDDKATTLWNMHDQLVIYGATPVHERVWSDLAREKGEAIAAGWSS